MDTTKNPFARLDTSLMRSTKPLADEDEKKPRVHASTPIGVQSNTRTSVHANTLDTSSFRPLARQTGYSLYQDQEDFLRDYTLQEKLNKRQVSAAQIIREALDNYIETLKKKQR